MRTITRLVVISVIAMSMVAAVSPLVAPSGQRCSTCHTGSNPSGGYLFKLPSLKATYPLMAPPNTTLTYSLKMSNPGMYIVRSLVGAITAQGAGRLLTGEVPSKAMPNMELSGGSTTASWAVETGNSSGLLYINSSVKFTAHHLHTTAQDSDDSPYMLSLYSIITVRPVALFATNTDMTLNAIRGSSASFDLVSYSEVRNISLVASSNINATISIAPQFVESLAPNGTQSFEISVVNGSRVVDNGRIDILWENETGSKDATFVMVRTVGAPPPPAATSPLSFTGRVTGILSLCLLISSVVLGLVKAGGKRRVRVHCAVSWFIIGLSVYHGLMLVYGPYSRVWLANWVLLGYISAAVMGVSGVNGLAQSWMSRKLSHRTWLWVHRITLIAAIVLVVIHALQMGTDLKFIRDLYRPDKVASACLTGGQNDIFGFLRSIGGH